MTMKYFSAVVFVALIGIVAAHDVCEFRRVSLGITKTAAECQAKCNACKPAVGLVCI